MEYHVVSVTSRAFRAADAEIRSLAHLFVVRDVRVWGGEGGSGGI